MIKREDGSIVLTFKPKIITNNPSEEKQKQNTYIFEEPSEETKTKNVTPFPNFPGLPPIIIKKKSDEELQKEAEEWEKQKQEIKEQKEKEERERFREQKLGKGTYGNVYTSEDGNVVKRYKILENGIQVDMLREISIMKLFSHPNILPCISYDLSKKEIIMPYYSYNLQDYMDKYSLNSEMIQNIFYSCCKAIYTLHCRNIVHRDIKPDNILINLHGEEINVALCDYGMSRPLKGDMTNKVCTIWYRPFELFVGQKDYGTELDVWSLGCVLGEMLLEEPLFPHKSGIEMIQSQLKLLGTPEKCDFNFKNVKLPRYKGDFEKTFYNVEQDSKFVLKRMLDLNPSTRITVAEVLTFITDKFHVASTSTYNAYLKDFPYSFSSCVSSSFINDADRTIMVDWLMDLRFNSALEIDDHTYFRAVSIMDQYISHLRNSEKENGENKENKQLVAACSLWVSSKIEGRMDEDDLVELGDGAYDLRDLVKMEKEIVSALNFNFLNPTLIDYLEFYDGNVYYELLNRVYAVTLYTDFLNQKSFKQVVKDCYNYEAPYVIKAHTNYKARQFAV